MNRLPFFLGVCCLFLTSSCDLHSKKNIEPATALEVNNIVLPTGTLDTAIETENEKLEDDQSPKVFQKANTDWDKKMIKTGTLNIQADIYQQYDKTLRVVVQQWGGYIASEKENATEDKKENAVTIKVPVQYFDDAMQQLSAGKGKVMDKEITTSDVTGEYADTRARMEAKKRTRMRYVDILQKAKKVQDVLDVEKEINAMQEDIEATEARVNYLQHSAAYSTIHLTYYQLLRPRAKDTPPGFAQRIWSALLFGAKGLSELILVLVALWPLWIVGVVAIWLVRRGMMRNKTKLSHAKL